VKYLESVKVNCKEDINVWSIVGATYLEDDRVVYLKE
jgi:hypothetical protein